MSRKSWRPPPPPPGPGGLRLETLSSPRSRLGWLLLFGPYSFSGRGTSVVWALDLVIAPGGVLARQPVTVSPYGEEVLLHRTRRGGGGGGGEDGRGPGPGEAGGGRASGEEDSGGQD